MVIDELIGDLKKLISGLSDITGESIQYAIYPKMDIGVFPDNIENIIGPDRNGIYVFSGIDDDKIYYIGIANDVVKRFYDHIGKKTVEGFTYKKPGKPANFPMCELAEGRPWLAKEVEKAMKRGQFNTTFIIPNIKEAKGLIEELLIYYCWAKGEKSFINVMK